MISIKNLNKSFGHVQSVKNLNIEVKEGEIYGFLGPNGAGKSTTIKILVGIYKKDLGDVKIGGFDIEDVRAKQIFGYIPDEPYVYQRLNTNEFLHFIGNLYGLVGNELEERVKYALSLFLIDEDPQIQIQDFSRGSRQKVMIAAALMHNPKVLVVDEPMVGLDPKAYYQLIEYFKTFSTQGGTIFLSTHSLDVVEKVCTRVGIINKGELVIEGAIQELERITSLNNLEDVFLKLTNE